MDLHETQYHWLASVLPVEGRIHILGELPDLKESHLLETTEYAVTQGIDHEPAFN
jgi:hypothetical protein